MPSVTQPRPSLVEPPAPPRDYDFKLFGIDRDTPGDGLGLTIVSKSATSDGKTRLRCIASSSVEDRHGDTITEGCIRDMKRQATGLTIFLNHQYDWPEDVFGTIERASTTVQDGTVLLGLTIVADEEDERVATSIRKMENGIRAGISIGAMILDYELKEQEDEDAWFPALTINKVELLEASIVGIPANPKSWVDQVVKSFRTKGVLAPEPKPMMAKLGNTVTISADPPEPEPEPAPEPEPVPMVQADSPEEITAVYLDMLEGGLDVTEQQLTESVAKSITWGIENGRAEDFAETRVEDLVGQIFSLYAAPVRPDTDKSGDEPAPEAEATAEDDPEDALEAVEEDSDSGAADEGADEAEKEADAQLDKLAEAGTLGSLSELTDVLRESLTSLIAEREARASVEAERDILAAQLRGANDTVEAAVRLVKTLMDLPAGRKSQMGRIVERSSLFSRLKGSVYADEVLALIENGERM